MVNFACSFNYHDPRYPQGSSRLKRHLKNYHSEEEEGRRASYKFECPECYKKIRTKNLLDCHIKVLPMFIMINSVFSIGCNLQGCAQS